jgi:NADPH-dependent curcumin reductase CurA
MRLRMSEIKNYAPPAAIGEVMVGSTFGPSHCNAQR